MIVILKNKWKEAAIVILLILCIFSITQCNKSKHWSKVNEKNFLSSEQKFNSYKDKVGKEIAIQRQIIASKNSETAKLIVKVDSLKQVKGQVRVVTVTKVKNIKIPIEKPVYIDTMGNRYLMVPAKFSLNEKWYGQAGRVGLMGSIEIDSLYFNSEPVISFGIKKRKLKEIITFKAKEPVVVYFDRNPHSRVLRMENIFIKDKLSRVSIGIQAGWGMTIYGPSPYLGAGVSVKLIEL